MQTLLMGTALTRAGATNTKSGTWLREMAIRAMPGTSMMSRIAFKKHEEALKALGMVDDKDQPTWFTDGKPDLMKMLKIGHEHAAAIPLTKRAAYERQLFGAQGSGAFSLLSDNALYGQVQNLGAKMNSPEFKNRYAGFTEAYRQGSTVQNARTAMAAFNNTMMDLGARVLPSVNGVLNDFKGVLEKIRGLLPNVPNAGATVGARAIEGAGAGALWGLAGGPYGAVGGAVIGGALGTAEGFIEQYNKPWHLGFDSTDRASREAWRLHREARHAEAQKIEVKPAPISLSLNVDGQLLAQTMTTMMMAAMGFPAQAPTFDGSGTFVGGDHQHSDN
jgi:hypothetical protein